MKHTEIEKYVTCDICGRKYHYANKFKRLFTKVPGIRYFNIKKYKIGKIFIVSQLLGDLQDIDICDRCCNSIKEHLDHLSTQYDPLPCKFDND